MKSAEAPVQPVKSSHSCCGDHKVPVAETSHQSDSHAPCKGDCCKLCKILKAPVWGVSIQKQAVPILESSLPAVTIEILTWSSQIHSPLPDNQHDPTYVCPRQVPLRV